MRYVAKIHVLDVLDQIVVSGYVYDADGPVRDGEPPLEFCYQVPGVGADEPLAWLLNGLYRALVSERSPAREGVTDGAPARGGHRISETTPKPRHVMG